MELFTTKDNTTLNYITKGSGQPVVLIHSAFENYSIFDDIATQLSYDYQVVSVDLRGHGYSDKPLNIDFADYVEDIKDLLDYLYIKHAFFIGQELGATIAADFASKYAEYSDGIILINPATLQAELPEARLYRKYADQIRTLEENKQQKFLDKHTYGSPKKAGKMLKHFSDTLTLMTRLEKEAVTKSFEQTEIDLDLHQIKAPALIIVGKYDERLTPQELDTYTKGIVQAQVETFEHSGLYPMGEEKKAFLETVTAFINVNEVLEDEQKRVTTQQ
ncbi:MULTISPECIES: alpha/beta fold hydrolase [Staphylococcus]|uniref:alpha/beta fold hydrolase n=1 Tax=Staphylococcus TaxID=1279 RepID=UPI000763D4B1|nr:MULTISPECIES: alpha/beta hydrolase [Staphylococcus]AVO02982.1 alpha/beta hydrolase [Staphylococcus simulans]AVO05937.1 alpha/beta hydrolase [Staphylococcus simulans]AWG19530.1 alpha/beta hydrolase [Staphylococcus simulans]AWI02480.1 alpha/beta hydrolase [Staphylococcus simulans]KXA46574.1 hydrolase, alpha/beta domain protein [Staphylococcus simulans]